MEKLQLFRIGGIVFFCLSAIAVIGYIFRYDSFIESMVIVLTGAIGSVAFFLKAEIEILKRNIGQIENRR